MSEYIDYEHGSNSVIDRLTEVLQDKQLYQQLLACRKSDAQKLLDCFQQLLDTPNLDSRIRNSLIVATQRISTKTGLYPTCYDLRSVVQIGDYPVAAGGFADIYKGEFQGKVVCIKTIRLYQKSHIEHALKKFSKEAIIWGQLVHPNIVTIYGIFRFRAQVSIVSQWMDNGDIVQYLKNNPSAYRLQLVLDIANGLAYLHENGIIHGDLKGTNILVDATNRARLIDFGVSSVSDPDIIAWTSQSASDSEGGTVRWQAPELFSVETATGGAKNSTASDVYAWGCVCFEIFTGEIPFVHISNNYAVVVAVKSGARPIRPPASSQPWKNWGLTNDIWLFMEQCWEEDPSQRPFTNVIVRRLSTCVADDRRKKSDDGAFAAAEFRRRMSGQGESLTVEFLNRILFVTDLSSGDEQSEPVQLLNGVHHANSAPLIDTSEHLPEYSITVNDHDIARVPQHSIWSNEVIVSDPDDLDISSSRGSRLGRLGFSFGRKNSWGSALFRSETLASSQEGSVVSTNNGLLREPLLTNEPTSADPKKRKKEAERRKKEVEIERRRLLEKTQRERARAVMQKRHQMVQEEGGPGTGSLNTFFYAASS